MESIRHRTPKPGLITPVSERQVVDIVQHVLLARVHDICEVLTFDCRPLPAEVLRTDAIGLARELGAHVAATAATAVAAQHHHHYNMPPTAADVIELHLVAVEVIQSSVDVADRVFVDRAHPRAISTRQFDAVLVGGVRDIAFSPIGPDLLLHNRLHEVVRLVQRHPALLAQSFGHCRLQHWHGQRLLVPVKLGTAIGKRAGRGRHSDTLRNRQLLLLRRRRLCLDIRLELQTLLFSLFLPFLPLLLLLVIVERVPR